MWKYNEVRCSPENKKLAKTCTKCEKNYITETKTDLYNKISTTTDFATVKTEFGISQLGGTTNTISAHREEKKV